VDEKPDFDKERNLMGYFGAKLSHPNLKRAKVASIIGKKGAGYDARVISGGNSDSKQGGDKSLVVPLKDFCAHVSQFEYNMNVSGYRLSIPNRFMEAFIVGTGILTDKLALKWYLPFDEEVIETTEMGYLPDEKVDWEKVESDIDQLPKVDKKKILELYNKKWAPEVVAQYIVDSCID
jgi:hypothetical protein